MSIKKLNNYISKRCDKIIRSKRSNYYKFGNQDYGYLWWLPYRNSDVVAAIGDGGNVIYK